MPAVWILGGKFSFVNEHRAGLYVPGLSDTNPTLHLSTIGSNKAWSARDKFWQKTDSSDIVAMPLLD
jgi:hypothetical protein